MKDPMHKDRTTDLGLVRINNDAVMSIASIAALEVRGVRKMGGKAGSAFCDIFRKPGTKGVSMQMNENEVKLTVHIVVDYGADIPKIADEVQENVKKAVEKMAALALSEVDVVVEGVASLPASHGRII